MQTEQVEMKKEVSKLEQCLSKWKKVSKIGGLSHASHALSVVA